MRHWIVALVVGLLSVGSVYAYGTVPASGNESSPEYRYHNNGYQIGPWSASESGALAAQKAIWAEAFQLFATPVAHYCGAPINGMVYYSAGTWGPESRQSNGDYTVGYVKDASGNCPPNPTSYNYTATRETRSVLTPTCPADSEKVGEACVCSQGSKPGPSGATCVPVNCVAVVEQYNLMRGTMETETMSLTGCLDGCNVRGEMSAQGPDGKFYLWNPQATSGYCEGTKKPADQQTAADRDGKDMQPAPQQVPPGKCPGTVNGQAVVVPCGKNGSGTQATTTAADGTTTKTDTQTDCVNGVCKTTTTKVTTPSGGGSPVTETTVSFGGQAAQGGKPPGLESGSGGGTGAGGGDSEFESSCSEGNVTQTCEGDAIQCAMVQEQHKRACELFEKKTEMTQLGIDSAKGEKHPDGHPAKDIEEKSTDFNQSISKQDLIGGSCPADIPVPINVAGGRVVWLRFSSICEPAQWLGRILVGLTALSCLGIVFVRGS